MEKKDFVINGELYIRIQPGIYDVTEELEEVEEEIYMGELEMTKENPDIEELEALEWAKEYKNCLLELQGEKDYSTLDRFYQLETDGYTYEIYSLPRKDDIETYTSIADLKKDFLSVREFLINAQYVGRNFYRLKPAVCEHEDVDDMFLKSRIFPSEYFVLYKYNDRFLINRISNLTGEEAMCIVDSRYIKDGEWRYEGPYKPEFDNKQKVYTKLVKQWHDSVLKYRNKGKR